VSIAKSILPQAWYNFYKEYKAIWGGRFVTKSYGQEGEDLILKSLFSKQKKGFFVDVGAHHPIRFSNTFLLYKLGWTGINLDAMPGSMNLFNKWRRKDLNLEIAISDTDSILKYYAFKEPALNGFSVDLSEDRIRSGDELAFTKEIKTRTLASVLDQYVPPGTRIDVLSVDVEGHDLQVLRSNDWGKYRPTVLLVETLGHTIEDHMQSEMYLFLKQFGYRFIAKTYSTSFFTCA
jgi:FkbM family methyltransferase